MAKQQWLGGLVVGVSLGVLGCGDDPAPVTDSGVDAGSDLGPGDSGPVDSGTPTDLGPTDTGTPADTGPRDSGPTDTGPTDTGPTDSGTPADTGPTDSGTPADTGPTDSGTPADTGPTDSGTPATARRTATHGSAVVLTSDDRITVATNRTAHSVSIFATTLTGVPSAMAPTVIATPDAEPWAAVIGSDDNTAYVILRRTQELIRIGNLRTMPTITGRVTVGSEPTGLAISPLGGHVYVANWADGTVSDVNVSGATMSVARTINLNPTLAGTGRLGPSVTAATVRAGLAHPRAIVVTNDLDTDESDETVYVTEFFAQTIDASLFSTLPAGEAALDVNRGGLVYRFNAGTGAIAAPINLQAFRTTSASTEAGCFPNQLYAAAIKGDRLFVTSVCESPRRPVNSQQNLFAAISLINLTTNLPDTDHHVLLTREFETRYAATATAVPDTNARRFPLVPNDISFLPMGGGNVAYVSSYGSDAIFRVEFNADFSLAQVGQGTALHFIGLNAGTAAGRLPIGIAVANTVGSRAVALNENTRNLSLIDLSAQSTAAVVQSAPAPTAASPEDRVNIGRRFFVTGLARWSRNGQGWGSCEGCHPDGLTDNVTWTFAAGPRQTTSLDGTFDRSGTHQRVLNWTGILDEVHDFEGNTRGTSGGVGALVHANSMPPVPEDRIHADGTTPVPAGNVATATPQFGLSGSTRAITAGTPGAAPVRSLLEDWENIDLYVRTIRPPRAPSNLVAADVTAGAALFAEGNCAGCHGSPTGTNLWTVSRRFYEPSEARNNPLTGTLRVQTYTGFPTAFAGLNPPSANPGRTSTFRISAANAALAGSGDQINCVLRSVGTVGGTLGAPTAVAPTGVSNFIFEVKANGTPAQGFTGFNPPSLVGMGTGAPFFHAGNARTLEEVLSDLFRTHHQALSANFLVASADPAARATAVRQLAAYLVSIDDQTTPVPFPTHPTISSFDLCTGFTP